MVTKRNWMRVPNLKFWSARQAGRAHHSIKAVFSVARVPFPVAAIAFSSAASNVTYATYATYTAFIIIAAPIP